MLNLVTNSAEKIKALIIIKNYQIFDIPENAIFGSKPFDSGGVTFLEEDRKTKIQKLSEKFGSKDFSIIITQIIVDYEE